MKNKKPYTLEEIKQHSTTTTAEDSSTYIDEDIRLAEEQISKMQVNVNFRWNQAEVERARKIAEKKGLKYQTYIKSTLKQQMDKDEKDLAS